MSESDTKYRLFFENSADAMLIIENGIFVDCNSATVEMLGYDRKEEVINTPPFKLSPEFQPDGCSSYDKAREMMQLAEESGNHQFEWNHLRKNGTAFPVEVSLTAIKTSDRIHLHTVWRDISKRKRAEKSMRESEKRFRQIFESNPDPVILATLKDGVIIDVNKAFETVTGTSRAKTLGNNSKELGLWTDSNLKPFQKKLQRQREVNNFEVNFRFMGDQIITGLLSARLLKLGNELCVLIVIRDITTEKAAERALVEMDRMKSEFISAAAHELNTPLSAIMGFTELLLNRESPVIFTEEQKQDFLTEVYDKGEALSGIIDDLLDVGRIESGQPVTLDLKNVDLGNVLFKVVNFFQKQSPGHSLRLDLPDDPELLMLSIDRHRIIQVLENLLSNAVKYSPEESEIVVKCRPNSDGWEIRVEDSGIGMTTEQVARVFDKFYRVDASNTSVSGLGLGMNIVRQIVEAHGGSISVDSKLGEGTRVCFSLPIVGGVTSGIK